jgi:ASC-1-like (ASCH) protein
MVHVAIVDPRCARDILAGVKTIESRLSLQRRAPFGRVAPGDVIYFKRRSGRFAASARVRRVASFEALTPARVDRLRERFDARVRGGRAYWAAKRASRYATLIWLTRVAPVDTGPEYRGRPGFSPRAAWHTL